MNTKRLLCLASAFVFGAVTLGYAQSLPELAKLEKQRRAKMRAATGPSKLYTEGDKTGAAIDPSAEATAAASGSATAGSPTPAASGKKEKTAEELAAERQKEWADKVKAAQDEIRVVEDAIAKNERSLASMYNITPARQDMINAIEADKKRVAALKQSLVDLEEQRRRAGMPRPR
jgi:septal ring factor EnvC (AmiA/AmiB activator)